MAHENVLIPQNAADILKCSLCEKYLSVPPIFTSDFGTDRYRCGRCIPSSDNNITTRAKIYEKLAQFMLFPCINRKCKENLSWGMVLDHEKVCRFRTITCPSDDCELDIEILQVIKHFDSYHLEYKKTNFLEVSDVSLNTENFTVFLLVKFKKPFLFFQYTNETCIWFSIFCFHEEDSNNIFDVKFVSKNNSFTVCGQKILLYNNREHCINCIMRLCNMKSHKYSEHNFPYRYSRSSEISEAIMTIKLDNHTIKNILKSDSVDYTVTIRDETHQPPAKKLKIKTRSSRKEDELKEKEETRENIDKILMENIECPVCSSYMSSPIYLCQTGHSLCGRCLNRLQKCPFCQAKFVNSRNYSLEKISEIFKITQPSRPKQRI